jgi:membrane associated rhomboid family serine protease
MADQGAGAGTTPASSGNVVKKFLKDRKFGTAVFVVYMIAIWALAGIIQVDTTAPWISYMMIVSRVPIGLVGIITTIFCHADFEHVAVNSLGLIVLSFLLLYVFRGWKEWAMTTAWVVLASGFFTWVIGRSSDSNGLPVGHCGASGMIFGHFAYLIVVPCVERPFRWQSLLIAVLTGVLYGGLVFGIFSSEEGVSWESHLSGAVAGLLWAFLYHFVGPRVCKRCCGKKYEMQVDDGTPMSTVDEELAVGEQEPKKDVALEA